MNTSLPVLMDEYIKVIYGWNDLSDKQFYKVAILHKLLLIDPMEFAEMQSLECEQTDEFSDYIFNSELLEKLEELNEKNTWTIGTYPWDTDSGLYFGLNVECTKVARFGEPRFDSLMINRISLDALNNMLTKEQKILHVLAKNVFQREPQIYIVSKEY